MTTLREFPLCGIVRNGPHVVPCSANPHSLNHSTPESRRCHQVCAAALHRVLESGGNPGANLQIQDLHKILSVMLFLARSGDELAVTSTAPREDRRQV